MSNQGYDVVISKHEPHKAGALPLPQGPAEHGRLTNSTVMLLQHAVGLKW